MSFFSCNGQKFIFAPKIFTFFSHILDKAETCFRATIVDLEIFEDIAEKNEKTSKIKKNFLVCFFNMTLKIETRKKFSCYVKKYFVVLGFAIEKKNY